jgi:hypothetical protein
MNTIYAHDTASLQAALQKDPSGQSVELISVADYSSATPEVQAALRAAYPQLQSAHDEGMREGMRKGMAEAHRSAIVAERVRYHEVTAIAPKGREGDAMGAFMAGMTAESFAYALLREQRYGEALPIARAQSKH